MLRQLRHHVPGGWYHITTRGLGRRKIFHDDRDHEYFITLLSGMVERYGIVLKDKGVNTNERAWCRLLPFSDVKAAVETVKGEPWSDFVNRHGDRSRDIALYVGRLRCGSTLKDLGEYTDIKVQAVSQAAMRIEKRLKREKQMCDVYKTILRIIRIISIFALALILFRWQLYRDMNPD